LLSFLLITVIAIAIVTSSVNGAVAVPLIVLVADFGLGISVRAATTN
jgi:hypothetical protein